MRYLAVDIHFLLPGPGFSGSLAKLPLLIGPHTSRRTGTGMAQHWRRCILLVHRCRQQHAGTPLPFLKLGGLLVFREQCHKIGHAPSDGIRAPDKGLPILP
jgi:hypothetical protein